MANENNSEKSIYQAPLQGIYDKIDEHKSLLENIGSIKENDLASRILNFKSPSISESFYNSKAFKKASDAAMEAKTREKQELIRYRESVVNALQGIEKNTATLTEMTLLLQKSGKRQDEIFAIMVEILAIMKSNNEEEAKSRFTTVMEKITAFKDNTETAISLYGMAQTVYNTFQSLTL